MIIESKNEPLLIHVIRIPIIRAAKGKRLQDATKMRGDSSELFVLVADFLQYPERGVLQRSKERKKSMVFPLKM